MNEKQKQILRSPPPNLPQRAKRSLGPLVRLGPRSFRMTVAGGGKSLTAAGAGKNLHKNSEQKQILHSPPPNLPQRAKRSLGPLVRLGPRSFRMTGAGSGKSLTAAGAGKNLHKKQRAEADSSLTTPKPTPKSGPLFRAPGTFGAPFVQNDSRWWWEENDSRWWWDYGVGDGTEAGIQMVTNWFNIHGWWD
jgi:hypothetical protein